MFSGRKCESIDKALFLLVALLMAIAVQAQKSIVVDQHGTGDFNTNVCFNHHLNGFDGLNNCQNNKLDYAF